MKCTSRRTAVLLILMAVIVAACNSDSGSGSTSGTVAQGGVAPTTAAPPSTGATEDSAPTPETSPPSTVASEISRPRAPSAADIVLPANLVVTPSQGEGPYYPVAKPDDRDNDLLVVAGGDPVEIGTPLEISGLVVREDGSPAAGATVEIWQVDGQGIYDHPRAPDTDSRDLSFQFYGEAVTDGDGFWTFLTLDPVLYESRPRHIHVKVNVDGEEVLTTQIYFEGDALLADDGLAATAGDDVVLLTTNAIEGTLSNGLDGLIARHIIVLPG